MSFFNFWKTPVGSVSGRVFVDSDGDNTEKKGHGVEDGYDGLKISLVNAYGHVVATTWTDHNGNYHFGHVPKGDYKIHFAKPDGFDYVKEGVGGYDVNSNADAHTGKSPSFHVGAGSHVSEIDAGVKPAPKGSIEGRVFIDSDGDNTEKKGHDFEAGAAAVTVVLLDAHGNVVASTKTDDHGIYRFNDVVEGDYKVHFGEPDGFDFVKENVGSYDVNSNADVHTGKSPAIHVRAGEHVSEIDAGLKPEPKGSVEGRVFIDSDHDNTEKKGWFKTEGGLEGAEVSLIDAHGNVVATTTTDAHGNYSFDHVTAGDYSVHFEQPKGFAFVKEGVGHYDVNSNANVSTGNSPTFHVAAGKHVSEIDAGVKELPAGSVEGRVFIDSDGDNTELKDLLTLELGFDNAKVSLLDAHGNVVDTTFTDAHGNYSFEHVLVGTYQVQFEEPADFDFVHPDVGDFRFDSDADVNNGKTVFFHIRADMHLGNVDAGVKTVDIDGNEETCPEGPALGSEAFGGSLDDDLLEAQDGFESTIAGNAGDDVIFGSSYDDFLLGNPGDDELYGRCGDDTLHGGSGDDLIVGGPGIDILQGDGGADTLTGNSGADIFFFNGRSAVDGALDIATDFDETEGDTIGFFNTEESAVRVEQAGDDVEIYVNDALEILVLSSSATAVNNSLTFDFG